MPNKVIPNTHLNVFFPIFMICAQINFSFNHSLIEWTIRYSNGLVSRLTHIWNKSKKAAVTHFCRYLNFKSGQPGCIREWKDVDVLMLVFGVSKLLQIQFIQYAWAYIVSKPQNRHFCYLYCNSFRII